MRRNKDAGSRLHISRLHAIAMTDERRSLHPTPTPVIHALKIYNTRTFSWTRVVGVASKVRGHDHVTPAGPALSRPSSGILLYKANHDTIWIYKYKSRYAPLAGCGVKWEIIIIIDAFPLIYGYFSEVCVCLSAILSESNMINEWMKWMKNSFFRYSQTQMAQCVGLLHGVFA